MTLSLQQLEQKRNHECPYRRSGPGVPSCGLITQQLGWTAGMALTNCDQCWDAGSTTPSGAAAREAFKRQVIDHLLKREDRIPVRTLQLLVTRHLPAEEAKALIRRQCFRLGDSAIVLSSLYEASFEREIRTRLENATSAEQFDALPPNEKWSLVALTWERAESFAASLVDDLIGRSATDEEVALRQSSCDGCPSRALGKDGHHYCSDCGCGERRRARLDRKLHYKYLACPRRRPGFANAAGTPINVPLFDRAVCVNLNRRKDRWDRFEGNTRNLSCLPPIVRVAAIEGDMIPKPHGWNHGSGTYGCRQSHMRVLEDAMMAGEHSVLIFEDDAYFPPDFPEKFAAFLKEVPSDWDGLMLGGQHVGWEVDPPTQVSPGVLRCTNGQRTHAFAVRGSYLRALYQEWATKWGHVDHLMGPLHKKWKVYAPNRFLVGQYAGDSNISGKRNPINFWNSLRYDDPSIAIYGSPLDDSYLLKDALSLCGIHFGNNQIPFIPGQTATVDLGLASLMGVHYPFPAINVSRSPEQLVSSLTSWRIVVGSEACNQEVPLGVYHPQLPLAADPLMGVLGPRAVSVRWRGLDSAFPLYCMGARENGLPFGVPYEEAARYEEVLLRIPADHEVSRRELEDSPRDTLLRLCALVGYTPSEDSLKAAIIYLEQA